MIGLGNLFQDAEIIKEKEKYRFSGQQYPSVHTNRQTDTDPDTFFIKGYFGGQVGGIRGAGGLVQFINNVWAQPQAQSKVHQHDRIRKRECHFIKGYSTRMTTSIKAKL